MFGFCITHILIQGVLKFEKKIRRQKVNVSSASQDKVQTHKSNELYDASQCDLMAVTDLICKVFNKSCSNNI